jgi:hypothetical protein
MRKKRIITLEVPSYHTFIGVAVGWICLEVSRIVVHVFEPMPSNTDLAFD